MGSVVRTQGLSLLGPQVQSLVVELRSCKVVVKIIIIKTSTGTVSKLKKNAPIAFVYLELYKIRVQISARNTARFKFLTSVRGVLLEGKNNSLFCSFI